MKKILVLLLFMAQGLVANDCEYNVIAGDEFTWKAVQYIHLENGENLLISPQNCWHALSLVYLGAKEDTKYELEQVVNPLRYPPQQFVELLQKQNATLSAYGSSKSALFVASKIPIRPEYQNTLKEAGLEKIEIVDFLNKSESIKTINSWVDSATKGKITELVTNSDINNDTVAMIISGLYFKAAWQLPFPRDKSLTLSFYPFTGTPLQAPMMRQANHFLFARNEAFSYVVLPFNTPVGASEIEMELMLLPQTGYYSAGNLAHIAQSLRTQATEQRLDLVIPRFKTSMRWDVRDTLEKMGINLPFSDSADFSDISTVPLKIQKVFQECYIDVNEEGTEGAAATAASFALTSIRETQTPIEVVFNRPFYFAVREKISGTILFFGLIENPVNSSK